MSLPNSQIMNVQDIKTLKGKVEHVLKKTPRTRDSDTMLTAYVWYEFYKDSIVYIYNAKNGREEPCVRMKDLLTLPREDAISRVRRKFQEDGLYLPTSKKVALKRKINEEVWRQWVESEKSICQER